MSGKTATHSSLSLIHEYSDMACELGGLTYFKILFNNHIMITFADMTKLYFKHCPILVASFFLRKENVDFTR